MHIRWSAHLKGKEKEDFQDTVARSGLVLGRLSDIIEEKIKELEAGRVEPNYGVANWPYLQADLNGSIRQLKSILEFTKLER